MTVNKLYKQLITDLKKYACTKKKKRIRLHIRRCNKLTGRHLSAKYLARKFEDLRTGLNPNSINQIIQPCCKEHQQLLSNLLIELKKQQSYLSKYKHKTIQGILSANMDRVSSALNMPMQSESL
ncbi:hypothetical protein [Piscirickettsia litoralis]|uniref:Uncharacterized protein n=1 Tax=Piscirickettsia litoralis TaxID=1891921 RepID=A0ABX3A215_9GAMM|nr:hypothetical protein [Piscirickettsia litoralis]ODN42277.1 hypothetical protein BGC07_04165 [Piscirickettsia litoralis]